MALKARTVRKQKYFFLHRIKILLGSNDCSDPLHLQPVTRFFTLASFVTSSASLSTFLNSLLVIFLQRCYCLLPKFFHAKLLHDNESPISPSLKVTLSQTLTSKVVEGLTFRFNFIPHNYPKVRL